MATNVSTVGQYAFLEKTKVVKRLMVDLDIVEKRDNWAGVQFFSAR